MFRCLSSADTQGSWTIGAGMYGASDAKLPEKWMAAALAVTAAWGASAFESPALMEEAGATPTCSSAVLSQPVQQTFTMAEVAEHDSPESCWLVIDGFV